MNDDVLTVITDGKGESDTDCCEFSLECRTRVWEPA